jgi:hypothetical protein
MLREPSEVEKKLDLTKRRGSVAPPDNTLLVNFITEHLLQAARSGPGDRD